MSIDLNWDTLTTGPDGLELALRIRDFIHSKFQTVPLPRFIKSVTVHDFEFGTIPPELELKDITNPLPDFYEEADDDGSGDGSSEGDSDSDSDSDNDSDNDRRRPSRHRHDLSGSSNLTATPAGYNHHTSPPPPPATAGGVPGGTSSLLHHFHSHLAPGWSGTQTPLAAMAGAHHLAGEGRGRGPAAPDHHHRPPRQPSRSSSISLGERDRSTAAAHPFDNSAFSTSMATLLPPALREKHSVSTLAPTSAGGAGGGGGREGAGGGRGSSRPPTRDASSSSGGGGGPGLRGMPTGGREEDHHAHEDNHHHHHKRPHEPRPEDLQAVFRIRYAGDIKLLLTADILLDYPMPSFVGIPVRLSITGLTFDGVGVLAYIRKRVHFCFLSPDDALAAVGDDDDDEPATSWDGPGQPRRMGGLLQEVRVESEIGQREGGKQSLKNVGKVERFVLEQVRRIFEEEFVYPSFWTFLV